MSELLRVLLMVLALSATTDAPLHLGPTPPLASPVKAPTAQSPPSLLAPAPAVDTTTHYALEPLSPPEPYTLRWRVGVSISGRNPLSFQWPAHRPGWFHNWDFDIHTMASGYHLPTPRFALEGDEVALGMQFMPLVRTLGGAFFHDLFTADQVGPLAATYPGIPWMIGNEPDIREQDWSTPEEYARAYHEAYQSIKSADPSAQVVAGNLSQITPLRLRYLDAVLAAYADIYGESMPVDAWGMHTYILPESVDGWGAGIPPGIEADPDIGMVWTVEEHDSLELVAEQVRQMRSWMAAHGYQERPLWVTEYGILMPAEYGFPPERVGRFMTGSFDLFQSLCDPATGLAADGHRLVQRWVWFSSYAASLPTGNLFNVDGSPTFLMDTLAAYLSAHAHDAGPAGCTQ